LLGACLCGRWGQVVPLRREEIQRRCLGNALFLQSGESRVGPPQRRFGSSSLSSLRSRHGLNTRPHLYLWRIKRFRIARCSLRRHVRVRSSFTDLEGLERKAGIWHEPRPAHSACLDGLQREDLCFWRLDRHLGRCIAIYSFNHFGIFQVHCNIHPIYFSSSMPMRLRRLGLSSMALLKDLNRLPEPFME